MKLDTDSEVISRLSPMETRQTGMEGDGGRGTENIARAVGVYDAMRTDPSSLVCQRHQRPQHGRHSGMVQDYALKFIDGVGRYIRCGPTHLSILVLLALRLGRKREEEKE